MQSSRKRLSVDEPLAVVEKQPRFDRIANVYLVKLDENINGCLVSFTRPFKVFDRSDGFPVVIDVPPLPTTDDDHELFGPPEKLTICTTCRETIVLLIDMCDRTIFQLGRHHFHAPNYAEFMLSRSKRYRIYVDHPSLIAEDLVEFRRVRMANGASVIAVPYTNLFGLKYMRRIDRVPIPRDNQKIIHAHLVLGEMPRHEYQFRYHLYPVRLDAVVEYARTRKTDINDYVLWQLHGLARNTVFLGGLAITPNIGRCNQHRSTTFVFVHVPLGVSELYRFFAGTMPEKRFYRNKLIPGGSLQLCGNFRDSNGMTSRLEYIFYYRHSAAIASPIPWQFVPHFPTIVNADNPYEIWSIDCPRCDNYYSATSFTAEQAGGGSDEFSCVDFQNCQGKHNSLVSRTIIVNYPL